MRGMLLLVPVPRRKFASPKCFGITISFLSLNISFWNREVQNIGFWVGEKSVPLWRWCLRVGQCRHNFTTRSFGTLSIGMIPFLASASESCMASFGQGLGLALRFG